MQKFSKKEALRFGWDTMKSNLGFFILLLLIYFLLYIIPGFLAAMATEINIPLGIVLHILDAALTVIMQIGLIKIALTFCDNEKGRIIDLFSQYRLLFVIFFASILYLLIVFAGMLLLIIPGIILGIKYFFVIYLIIDRGFGPIEAFKKSGEITKGAKWDLFLFSLLLGLINLLGAMCCLIGLFATIPTSMVAMAFVYRKLLAQSETTPTEEKNLTGYE